MIGSHKPKELADVYKQVFQKDPNMEDGGWYGFQIDGTFITIGEHSEVKETALEPQRIILNFETTEVQQEFDRIKEIEGIQIIKEPYELQGAMIATLADPDGNYFQLMPPWED